MSTSSNPNPRNGSEIAVIGMAGRFPGAKNIDEYWRNLQKGAETVSFFTDRELEAAGVDPALLKNPHYVKARGIVEGIELFDASFFGLTPREAETIDPQHRLFLECAWQALEHAGYDPDRYEGLIGVYGGVGLNKYLLNNLYPNRAFMESAGLFQAMLGNDKDFAATRVSYKMNLKGPSVVVQTACSTGLVAVCQACQSLLCGESDIALAGACSLDVPQKAGYLYEQGGIHSPDGHCRAFDARAQGTVFSDGVGIVVLKRLEDALADGDCIHAVVKGAAMNNDGSFKAGYTAPSVDGQAKVIRLAQILAEIEPETITYVETHGTATALGDPIEIAALTQAFRAKTRKKGFCAIGSVKTNIGHTDSAAGIAGLIKTVLMLKNRQVPPSLHFERSNPEIDFAQSPFFVSTSLAEWKTDAFPLRAGVSSFGIGGTNAHVIMEEAPPAAASAGSRPWHIVLLSARTETALDAATADLADHLRQHPGENLADVAYTLQVGRKVFDHRRMAVCRDVPDAVALLGALDKERVSTSVQGPGSRDVVFLFTGQGSQYVTMGSELYNREPAFREEVDRCSKILQPHLDHDLREILYPASNPEQAAHLLTQTAFTQPALFTIEYALAKLWMSWGVTPAALAGHSIGEYAAACLAGVFSLEDALTLVARRGRLMQELPVGSMLAVPLPEQEVRPLLGEGLSLAVINGPSLCVVSGEKDAVEGLREQLFRREVDCRCLQTSHAFHSAMMEPIVPVFTETVAQLSLNPPNIPFVSNVTGTWITPEEATSPGYWARHLRHTVRFSDCLRELLREPGRAFLEVGPGHTFTVLLNQQPGTSKELIALSSIRHPKDRKSDSAFILNTLGRLWLAGVRIHWPGFYQEGARHRVALRTYPFERKRFWVDAEERSNSVPDAPRTVSAASARGAGSGTMPAEHRQERAYEQDMPVDRERTVVTIWRELLGVDQVGVHDNFFALGGNSLTALRMLSRVEKIFGKKIPLSSFKAPTVKQLVDFLSLEEQVVQAPGVDRYSGTLSRSSKPA